MLKMTMLDIENWFEPLPPEQQLTEEGLIKLERQIAKATKKNEEMFIKSEQEAEKCWLK